MLARDKRNFENQQNADQKNDSDGCKRMFFIDWFYEKEGRISLWFCVDYRKRNAYIVCESYIFSQIDECIDSLGDAKAPSNFDANVGSWQIKMDHEANDMAAIDTP